jgi:hypothetical protein
MTQLLQLDRDEISECYDVLKHHRASLDRNAKKQFTVGEEVWFSNKGKRIDCKIEKINRTRIIVRPLDGGRGWNVYPSSLHHADRNICVIRKDCKVCAKAIEDAAKAIEEDAKEQTFNPLTGDFE